MATYKPVLRLKAKTDKEGIVNIRVIEGRSVKHVSLKIRIPVKFWNDNANEVRKSKELDYETINSKIKEKLKELEAYEGQESYNPNQNNKASYLSYFENEYLPRKANTGTRIKYEMILKKLKAFRDDIKKKDILFSEIDTKLIHELNKFILKRCATNTANHYLKLIKQVLDKAIAENYYTYLRHPFSSFDFQNKKVKKSALEKEEIQKLLKCHIDESDLLYDTRNKFLTQLFLQGMRVSDLQLLRWNMIKGDNIEYKMLKTGTDMTVYINELVWHILIHQFKKLAAKQNILLRSIQKIENELAQLENEAKNQLKAKGYNSGYHIIISDKIKDSAMNKMIPVEPIYEQIKVVKLQLVSTYKESILYIASQKQYKDMFVFDFLQDEDFSNIKKNDFSKLTPEQYKTLKNKSIVYNRHLKDLQVKVGIETVLKSHLSRHSYAYLLLNNNVDVYSIGQSLGHTGGLQVTEKYLKGLKHSKTAEHNREIAEQFISTV